MNLKEVEYVLSLVQKHEEEKFKQERVIQALADEVSDTKGKHYRTIYTWQDLVIGYSQEHSVANLVDDWQEQLANWMKEAKAVMEERGTPFPELYD